MAENDAEPTVPILCSECETTTELPISEVPETLEQHNERLHDGEEVAEVDPEIAEEIADLVAEDLGLLK